jgi:hypothetical protein
VRIAVGVFSADLIQFVASQLALISASPKGFSTPLLALFLSPVIFHAREAIITIQFVCH